MRKILILLAIAACYMMMGCSASRYSTINVLDVRPPKIEPLPVTADLLVTDTKWTGQAVGKKVEVERLIREATAKALAQDPPRVEGPDVLVGVDVYAESKGSEMKVTVTGYHAYYTNFRTTKHDTLSLAEIDSLRRLEYSEMFAVARILKELADEDSARILLEKVGKNKAQVILQYTAKGLAPEVETVKNTDGSMSKTVKPYIHEIKTQQVFDVDMLGAGISVDGKGKGKGKKSGGVLSVFGMKDDQKGDGNALTVSNQGADTKKKPQDKQSGGGGKGLKAVGGILGGILGLWIIIALIAE